MLLSSLIIYARYIFNLKSSFFCRQMMSRARYVECFSLYGSATKNYRVITIQNVMVYCILASPVISNIMFMVLHFAKFKQCRSCIW